MRRITSITFSSYRILDRKGPGHAGPLRSANHPCQSSSSWSFPAPPNWRPFLFRSSSWHLFITYAQRPFTAWLKIPEVLCHSLSFRYHIKPRARLVQIRCALNLDISVEWELLDSNTSPGLQQSHFSATLTLLAVS